MQQDAERKGGEAHGQSETRRAEQEIDVNLNLAMEQRERRTWTPIRSSAGTAIRQAPNKISRWADCIHYSNDFSLLFLVT